MRTLQISASNRSYDIHIGAGEITTALQKVIDILSPDHIIVITDSNVAPFYLNELCPTSDIQIDSIVLPSGEETKSFEAFQHLAEKILTMGITRQSCLVALGGGVIGDLVGFVASTILRGIRFVQIPTSLLAQVDSSVGGKTAINTAQGKNLVGSFHQPSLVIIDVETLQTLPETEFKSGYAEVLKYALIDDSQFLSWLDHNVARIFSQDRDTLIQMIFRCCAIKQRFVHSDEFESSIRTYLNFGHTFGHAIEKLSNFKVPHGRAVAIGIAMAMQYSVKTGLLDKNQYNFAIEHMKKAKLPLNSQFSIQEMIPLMKRDKKVHSLGYLTLVLLKAFGDPIVQHNIPEESLVKTLSQEGILSR